MEGKRRRCGDFRLRICGGAIALPPLWEDDVSGANHSGRAGHTLVPLRIFRSPTLVGGNLVLFAAGAALDGMLIIVTLYAQDVLGYSTVEFGLMMAVMTVMAIVGAGSGQAAVARIGPGPVALVGMGLIGGACVFLTQVSVDGTYLSDLFPGLVLFGAGLGSTFVASQIAGLTGVAEEESGLAAGLVDSSLNIGSALGIAVLLTVAVSRAEDISAGAGQATDPSLAMTEGFQFAFLVAVGIAAIGGLLALLMLGRGEEKTDEGVKKAVSALDTAPRPPCSSRGLPSAVVSPAEALTSASHRA